MNCKDCRHWAPNVVRNDDEPVGVGPSRPKDGHPCQHPKIGGSYSDNEHHASDAANSYETIITGPMFGCIHFEALT